MMVNNEFARWHCPYAGSEKYVCYNEKICDIIRTNIEKGSSGIRMCSEDRPVTSAVNQTEPNRIERAGMSLRRLNMKTRDGRVVIFWLIVIFVVLLDQTTKNAAISALGNESRVLIPNMVNLIYVENTGAAFSIGQGNSILFAMVGVAFFVASCLLVWHRTDFPMSVVVPLAVVAGGGLGNVFDRVLRGSVTDFISLAFIDFPVFNVADICVTIGTFFMVIGYWLWDMRRSESHDANDIA